MDKKKLIAAIAAISLTTGVAGFAVACGEGEKPKHTHTYSQEWTAGESTHWHESTCIHKGLKQPGSEAPHVDEDNDRKCDDCAYDMRETVAITVADVKGGTVTLDNARPKYGDTVTATVTADEGYIFKSVKLGDEDKTLDAQNKFTFTATEAVTITAAFEGKTVSIDTTAVETSKGSVAFEFAEGKTEYKVGDDVVLKVTTDDYYRLSALYINGKTDVNYADAVSNEGLILVPECGAEKLVITAEFIVGYRDITVNVKGRRIGADVVLDVDCGLSVSGYSDATLQSGAVTLTKAEVGKTYIVSFPSNSGWQGTSFTVGESKTYNVVTEWAPKLRYPEHSKNIDLSDFNEGSITSMNDLADVGLYTEAFIGQNAMFTVNFSIKDFSPSNDYPRQFAGFMFERNANWYAKNIAAHIIGDGNNRLEWNGNEDIWGCGSLTPGVWGAADRFCNPLPADLLEKYKSDAGVDLTMIRKNGNEFYLFLGGHFVEKRTIDAKYKDVLASPMIVNPRLTDGNNINFSLTEDVAAIDAFLKSTVKIADSSEIPTGVTVKAEKASDAFKENVTLTVTVPEGKIIGEFIVDGKDLTAELSADNKYIFSGWRMGGAHEFDIKIAMLDPSTVVTSTVKTNAPDGTKIRFVRDGETTVEKTVSDGEVEIETKVGAWKVQVYGFNTWLNCGAIGINGKEKSVDVNNIFSVGASGSGDYVYDMAKGTITWNAKTRPDMRLNVTHTQGQDMWIATKLRIPEAALNLLKTRANDDTGMSYGLGFVDSANKVIHADIYTQAAEHSYLMYSDPWKETDAMGYWHDFLTGPKGNKTNGKYADAMVGDGAYLIERYNATTGYTEYWVGESLDTIVLLHTFKNANTLGTNALITAAGLYGGSKFSPGIDFDFAVTLGIGETLEAALGVAGQKVKVNVTGNLTEDSGALSVSEFTRGQTANIELTVESGYAVTTTKINGKTVNFTYNETEDKFLYAIDRYLLAELNIDVTVEEVKTANIDATVTAKQQSIVTDIVGKTFTLADGPVTASGTSEYTGTIGTGGKIAVQNVVIGTYTLKIAGYLDKQVEVTKDGMADVTVEYKFLTDANGQTNLTNMNDPTKKITWKDGTVSNDININTVDKYGDVYAQARFDMNFTLAESDMRATIQLVFDDTHSARIDLNVTKNWGGAVLQSTSWDKYFGAWGTKYTLTSDEIKAIKDNGYVDFAIERKGAVVNIYINGAVKFTYALKTKDGFDYANSQAGLNIQYCQEKERNNTHGFTLEVRESKPETVEE